MPPKVKATSKATGKNTSTKASTKVITKKSKISVIKSKEKITKVKKPSTTSKKRTIDLSTKKQNNSLKKSYIQSGGLFSFGDKLTNYYRKLRGFKSNYYKSNIYNKFMEICPLLGSSCKKKTLFNNTKKYVIADFTLNERYVPLKFKYNENFITKKLNNVIIIPCKTVDIILLYIYSTCILNFNKKNFKFKIDFDITNENFFGSMKDKIKEYLNEENLKDITINFPNTCGEYGSIEVNLEKLSTICFPITQPISIVLNNSNGKKTQNTSTVLDNINGKKTPPTPIVLNNSTLNSKNSSTSNTKLKVITKKSSTSNTNLQIMPINVFMKKIYKPLNDDIYRIQKLFCNYTEKSCGNLNGINIF